MLKLKPLLSGLILLSVGWLAGCTEGPLRAYEGPARPNAETALLAVPALLDVTAVDGHDASAGLLGPRDRQVRILPGEHVLTLRYIGVFRSTATADDDVVRSRPVALRFVAEPGASYQFRFNAPQDDAAAHVFAEDPHVELVDPASGKSFASTMVKSYAEASLLDTIKGTMQGDDGKGKAPATNLELLKDVWGRASADEKAAFQAWLNTGAKPDNGAP